ncbi:MAG: hypothetical protein EPO26_06580 [Chloroflexota bacterium]|nr:MAG: hypothetical protein EPO26_06580 [Chloroflexota bacterium]
MDAPQYLRRLAFTGPIERTIEVLKGLQLAHLTSVPYENLDIFPRSRPVSLARPDLYSKIVIRRRGGFCHELNQLFRWRLDDLGFSPTLVAALAVHFTDGTIRPAFSHQAIVVDVGGPRLVDVGFGGRNPRIPLRIDDSFEQHDGLHSFRISTNGDGVRTLHRLHEDFLWRPVYSFSLDIRADDEFTARCAEQQNEPPWNARRLCALHTPRGVALLSGDHLTKVENGVRSEQLLASDEERTRTLGDVFGLDDSD